MLVATFILIILKNLVFSKNFSVAFVSDIFIGETSPKLTYLENVIKSINVKNAEKRLDFVFLLGDLTTHGTPNEYIQLSNSLSKFKIPYFPLVGSNDVGEHGEYFFMDAFRTILQNKTINYSGNKPTKDSEGNIIYVQNFKIFSNDKKIVFLCLDWNSRKIHSNNVELFNVTKQWLSHELKNLPYNNINNVLLIQHIPFTSPYFFLSNDNWGFSQKQKEIVFNIIVKNVPSVHRKKIWGVISGHYNKWDYSYPFVNYKNNEFEMFNQYLIKSCSVDSSYGIMEFKNGDFTSFEMHGVPIIKWEFVVFEIFGIIGVIYFLLYHIFVLPFESKSLIYISRLFSLLLFGALMEIASVLLFERVFEQGFLLRSIEIVKKFPIVTVLHFCIVGLFIMNTSDYYFNPNFSSSCDKKTSTLLLKIFNSVFLSSLLDALNYFVFFLGFSFVLICDEMWTTEIQNRYDIFDLSYYVIFVVAIFWDSFFVRFFNAILIILLHHNGFNKVKTTTKNENENNVSTYAINHPVSDSDKNKIVKKKGEKDETALLLKKEEEEEEEEEEEGLFDGIALNEVEEKKKKNGEMTFFSIYLRFLKLFWCGESKYFYCIRIVVSIIEVLIPFISLPFSIIFIVGSFYIWKNLIFYTSVLLSLVVYGSYSYSDFMVSVNWIIFSILMFIVILFVSFFLVFNLKEKKRRTNCNTIIFPIYILFFNMFFNIISSVRNGFNPLIFMLNFALSVISIVTNVFPLFWSVIMMQNEKSSIKNENDLFYNSLYIKNNEEEENK